MIKFLIKINTKKNYNSYLEKYAAGVFENIMKCCLFNLFTQFHTIVTAFNYYSYWQNIIFNEICMQYRLKPTSTSTFPLLLFDAIILRFWILPLCLYYHNFYMKGQKN